MTRYGMALDLDRCTGCRACMEACKVENNTPQGIFWMHVFRLEEGEYPDVRISFMPRPCMHCDNPPCVKMCPTGARYKEANGLVATDSNLCTGIRYCYAVCPYGVNYFNWEEPSERQYLSDWTTDADLEPVTRGLTPPYKNPDLDLPHGEAGAINAGGGHKQGVIEKCTFCIHRLEEELLPACAANCPTNAIIFGDLDDPNSDVFKIIRAKRSFQLREEFGTRPKVYYVGSAPLAAGIRQIEKVGG